MTAATPSPAAAAIRSSSAASSTGATIVAYDGPVKRKKQQPENEVLTESIEKLNALIRQEAAQREIELQRAFAVARAEMSALLTEEHRRLAEERRDELVRAEQRVLTELTGRLISAQKEIEGKLAAWSQDMERTREGLATQLA